mmetsp:Transcript_10888/g.22774  ORF Transcript_10888/g.22774 Transcript_10888/m.22774 type:complete len:154 (+) Transcript_10888:256-717(+)
MFQISQMALAACLALSALRADAFTASAPRLHHAASSAGQIAIPSHLAVPGAASSLLPSSPSPPPPSSSSSWSTGQLLLLDAIFYHLQSVSAYCTMGCMSPVSQSVANTLKRALLVWASILYFGNPVTSSGVLGMVLVVLGVFLYNHMRRLYQS